MGQNSQSPDHEDSKYTDFLTSWNRCRPEQKGRQGQQEKIRGGIYGGAGVPELSQIDACAVLASNIPKLFDWLTSKEEIEGGHKPVGNNQNNHDVDGDPEVSVGRKAKIENKDGELGKRESKPEHGTLSKGRLRRVSGILRAK